MIYEVRPTCVRWQDSAYGNPVPPDTVRLDRLPPASRESSKVPETKTTERDQERRSGQVRPYKRTRSRVDERVRVAAREVIRRRQKVLRELEKH